MWKWLCRVHLKITLFVALMPIGLSACSNATGLSLVDYSRVSATPPPKELTGLWTGPHAGGTFFMDILADGQLQTCLSSSSAHQAMDGKYADEALYLEDGTRIEFRMVGIRKIVIYSPPGNPVTTLERKAPGPAVADCLTTAATAQHQLSSSNVR